ncbi:MAG: hypothetical protein DRQ88_08800 [Epsilonproteobacteria bacterium]|nr:MAG: hypothetical protein DRQ89_13330 [Campylobacterota bacterium]RLA65735.1 MAG: hypothetical protein DRQ88_08800 [Campylobacterota bacterium]
MNINYLANLSLYIPEIMVIFTLVGLLFIEATYSEEEKGRKLFFGVMTVGLVLALLALVKNLGVPPASIFTNAVIIDPFSTIVKILMVAGTLFTIYLGQQSRDIYSNMKAEFALMAIGVLVGGMLLASANNMLTTYIGVETLSILSYVMATLKKNDDRSSEAGIKYVLYGGVASGMMVFGISHIFGVFGSIQFVEIYPLIKDLSSLQMAILIPSFIFFFVGLGYKIACVPFHMWAPDVYEGSPLPVTTFFAIVPKMAGMAILLRVTMIFFGPENTVMHVSWVGVLQVVAALTMIVGNVSAIAQKSVKRMLAYSSIGQAGFMLLGVVVIDDIGVSAVLFYMITYLFMTLVAFFITSFVADKYGNDHFERFSGLGFRYPLMGVVMAVVMFSLTGVPPFAGFIAKFNIFYAAINQKLYTLVLIGGLTSVISFYFYVKVIRFMFFTPAESEEKIGGFGYINQGLITALAVPVLFLGIFWSGLITKIVHSKLFFVQ